MEIIIDNNIVNVYIDRKITNKNTYLRVKEDLNLYITTNTFINDKKIKEIIKDNMNSIVNMYNKQLFKKKLNDSFYYLGKKYDIVRINANKVSILDNKIFIPTNLDIDKWLKKEALRIFKERLDYWYKDFTYDIPYPSLTIRKMKTRWGVCNYKLKRVTLNFELIKKDIACLDYVINHELSHFIEMNHSSRFWKVVSENYPNYKEIRRILKNY